MNTLKKLLSIGGLWLAMSMTTHAGTVTYVYTDNQGTPLAEADAQGNVTATFDYRPYGAQALGTPPKGPGYTGHVNDPDTGLVYMQARYYDPIVGRFLSTDPVKPTDIFNFSRYVYADNRPTMLIDPDGRNGELAWSSPNQVTYTVRYVLTGVAPQFTPAEVDAQIAKNFSGTTTINGTNVTVTAQAIQVTSSGTEPVNTINVVSTTKGVTASNRSETNKVGGDKITAGASGEEAASAITISHELGGHSGGAGDQYAGGVDVNGKKLSADVSGQANIMKDLSGSNANQQTLQEILKAPTNVNHCAAGVTAPNGGC